MCAIDYTPKFQHVPPPLEENLLSQNSDLNYSVWLIEG